MWAILTRLEEPKHAGLTRLQKLKLYNGKTLPGFTEENIKELREQATQEGMIGISPRYVQDKISNALVAHPDSKSINPFMVLNELESGLKHHSLITNEEDEAGVPRAARRGEGGVREHREERSPTGHRRRRGRPHAALRQLHRQRQGLHAEGKVKNRFTGQNEEPDERLMRSIEEKIDIPDSRKDDFRREIMNYIGALSIDGKKFDYKTNERLYKALELKLFEDQKDSIKLTSLVSNVVDADTQQKIDVVKGRLIRDYGYDDESATDVLNYVASIFARGDTQAEQVRTRSSRSSKRAAGRPGTVISVRDDEHQPCACAAPLTTPRRQQREVGAHGNDENRTRSAPLPADRPRPDPQESAEIHHARRDDRPQGSRSGQHSRAAARHSALPLRRQRQRRRRPGRRRRRPAARQGRPAARRRRPGRQRSRQRTPDGSRRLARRTGRYPGRRAGAAPHRAQGRRLDRRREGQVQQHPPDRAPSRSATSSGPTSRPSSGRSPPASTSRTIRASSRSRQTSSTARGTRSSIRRSTRP